MMLVGAGISGSRILARLSRTLSDELKIGSRMLGTMVFCLSCHRYAGALAQGSRYLSKCICMREWKAVMTLPSTFCAGRARPSLNKAP